MPALASDNFNRNDETPLASPWILNGGANINLATNKASTSGLADAEWRLSGVSLPDNQYAQAVISGDSTSDSTGPGVLLRCSTSARTHYRIVAQHAASNNIEVSKRIAGTYTQLGYVTKSWTNGDTLKVVLIGWVFYVYINGVLGGTVTDSTQAIASNPNAGIVVSSSVTSPTWEDFECGSLSNFVALERGIRGLNRGLALTGGPWR